MNISMGTQHAQLLQQAIQQELAKYEYAPDDDPVMAEYITVMLANSKTPEKITAELMDLVGDHYDPAFTTWLFATASSSLSPRVEPKSIEEPIPTATPSTEPSPAEPSRDQPPHARRPLSGPTSTIFSRALSSSTSNPTQPAPVIGQKRAAPSQGPPPSEPLSKRRVSGGTGDAPPPTGPRSMTSGDSSKNLLDRLGGKEANEARQRQDLVQQKIDSITKGNGSGPPNSLGGQLQPPQPAQPMIQPGFNPGMMMMDPQFMGGMMGGGMGMAGAMGLQEMMMVQMAQMQAMQQQMQQIAASQNNRTGSNYNRNNNSNHPRKNQSSKPFEAALSDAPVPAPPAPKEAYPLQPTDTGLCKFSLGCTHPLCVYSHPSPAATPQSALVLSTEACEAGKDCKDPECVKSHVSPAQLGNHPTGPGQMQCKFQNCTNPACPFLHTDAEGNTTAAPALLNPALVEKPKEKKGSGDGGIGNMDGVVGAPVSGGGLDAPLGAGGKMCKYKSHCTRPDCRFTHPIGRVVPGSKTIGFNPYSKPRTSYSKTFSAQAVAPSSTNKSMVFNTNAKPFVPKAQVHISDRLTGLTEGGGEKIIKVDGTTTSEESAGGL